MSLSLKLFIIFFIPIYSFFSNDSPILQLNSSSFDSILTSPSSFLVLFYAPWCGHCKNFKPLFDSLSRKLKGKFNFAAIDADKEKEIAKKYGINGFPSVLYFGTNKEKPEKFKGKRNEKEIAEFLVSRMKKEVEEKIGEKISIESSNSNNYNTNNNNNNKNSNNNSKTSKKSENFSTEDSVVVLTDSTFSSIFSSQKMWMVAFYAPWCGHCKHLLPEWNAAADSLKRSPQGKNIVLAKIDATVNTEMARKYAIQGYPTIKVFSPGEKKNVEEYNGPRESRGIVEWALSRLSRFGFVGEIPQLTGKKKMDEVCGDNNGLCIILFVPHIADSSREERKKYLDVLKSSLKSVSGKPFFFLWAQGGDFKEFEDSLHLGFGYPALVAIHRKKKVFAVCRSSFSLPHLEEFFSSLTSGRTTLGRVEKEVNLPDVPKWDGKDFVASGKEDEL